MKHQQEIAGGTLKLSTYFNAKENIFFSFKAKTVIFCAKRHKRSRYVITTEFKGIFFLHFSSRFMMARGQIGFLIFSD